MKITDIQVDRFGVWRELSLPLTSSGLNVFYGPNEAGKSTLLRFIRSMLYGFDRFDESLGKKTSEVWEGTLAVDEAGKQCRIRRASRVGTRGLVSVTGLDKEAPADHLLSELLSGTNEKLFKHVFAVGLQELQELATLNDDDIAQHVYGLSLGPDGRRLLEVAEAASRARRELLDDNDESGELFDLLKRDEELSRELKKFAGAKEAHEEMCKKRDKFQTDINGMKARQTGIDSQLRGHLFLERIWKPWCDVRAFGADLDAIPHVSGFPANGIERLDHLEEQLAAAKQNRTNLVQEMQQLRSQADDLCPHPEIHKHSLTLQSFVDQREWVNATNDIIESLRESASKERETLEYTISQLGPDWSVERLEAVDTSPAANQRILAAARSYQSAVQRKARLRRRHDRMAKTCQKRMADLDERLGDLGGVPIDHALQNTRQRLAELEDFGHLSLQEKELDLQREEIRRQIDRLESREAIPKWVLGMLLFLLIAGMSIALLGIYTGLTDNVLPGASLVLVGLTGCGVGYGMKKHSQTDSADHLEQLHNDARMIEIRLRQTRETMDRVAIGEINSSTVAAGDEEVSVDHGKLIRATAARLAELERVDSVHQQLQTRRRRLSEIRERLRELQQLVGETRGQWCQILRGMGLAETVKVDEAFTLWQQVVEAKQAHRLWQQAESERNWHCISLEDFRRRIEELGQCVTLWDVDYSNPANVLAIWDARLTEYYERRQQRRDLLGEVRNRRKEAATGKKKIDESRKQRSALLVQGGAGSRAEFVARAEHSAHREEVEEYLKLAKADLDAAACTEPDLAIVEDDLLSFDAEENSEYIDVLRSEQEDLQTDLEQALEELGSIKQSITQLEDDRRATRVRSERARVRTELKQSVQQWLAVNVALRLVDQMRGRFERTSQPPVLSAASDLLKQLTAGKYGTIWTPLGKRHLCVDDEQGNTFGVEQLSNGTREQLFLAIRLAMVREFARKGTELPMVLDDIIVNFDQLRTEAAVETLLQFAEQGQQILLFTCHLHLAHLFESKGIEPIWLPGNNQSIEERRAG